LKKIFFCGFLIFFLNLLIFSQSKKVYYAEIDGEIDLGMAPYVSRVVNEANEENVDAIIFKINTFGGRVDAATQIKDAILSSKAVTIAFINNRAISAGALIALSCAKIAMVPGSSIGAATVVDETGQKVGEKYQSYMRSEMRSTAEKNGRRTDIAQGIVDERIVVEGLVDSTQLITLTTEEALKYKIADTVVTNIDELFAPSRPEGVLEGAPADLEAGQTALSNLENIAGRGSVDYQTIAPFLNESSTFAPGQTLDTAKLEKLEVGDYNRFLEYFRFRTREIAKDYLNNPTPDNLEALRKRVLQKYATEAFGAEGWNWIDAAFSGPHKKVLESLQRLAQTEVKGG